MDQMLEEAGTIVFVSHAIRVVESFCDRVMWLDARSGEDDRAAKGRDRRIPTRRSVLSVVPRRMGSL